MEEKERYELQEVFEDGSFHWCLKDNDTKLLKPLVSLHNCVDLLNLQDKEIKTLKTKLEDRKRFCISQVKCQQKLINKLLEENQQFGQSQKQLAISELEKLREYIVLNDKYDEEASCNIIETFDLLEGLADKIKSLKGE